VGDCILNPRFLSTHYRHCRQNWEVYCNFRQIQFPDYTRFKLKPPARIGQYSSELRFPLLYRAIQNGALMLQSAALKLECAERRTEGFKQGYVNSIFLCNLAFAKGIITHFTSNHHVGFSFTRQPHAI
jgi:hypothetical protein